MPAAPGSNFRTLGVDKRRFRSLGLVMVAAPLALGACVAENNGMKSAGLGARTPSQATPAGGPDAYGYAPVRLAALGDGARIALPSNKPDWAKLQTVPAAAPVAAAKKPGVQPLFGRKPATTAPEAPLDADAALQADVAERRAALVVMGQGKGDRPAAAAATPTAPQVAAVVPETKPETTRSSGVVASAKEIIDPRKSVPAAISAVAHSADAVRVAAIDTTAAAVNGTKYAIDSVQARLGDTFMTADTITGSAAIDDMIEQSAAENNIPTELAYAVVRVESHYKPNVVGGGAYGLSQIKPATARSLGFDGPAKGLFDPQTNLRYGMKYLAGAWEKSGHDICGAAMRYKGGHRTTRMTKAAATYCASVKKHMAAIERRRAPANRETIVAANERQKHIGEANRRIVDMNARARLLSASVAAEAKPAQTATPAAASQVASAARSPAGRAIAVPAAKPATTVASNAPIAAAAEKAKAGRVIRVYSSGDAAPAVSTFSASDRLGYAE